MPFPSPRRGSRLGIAVVAATIAGTLALSGAATATPTQNAAVSQVPVGGLTRVAVGQSHSCSIDDDDVLYCWGDNGDGQLGTGDNVDSLIPQAVPTAGTPLDGKAIDAVAAGDDFTCALATDDTLACWGVNTRGQLGIGSNEAKLVPTAVAVAGTVLDGADITTLSTQTQHICARTSVGTAACWGLGNLGQLGNGGTTDQTVPATVTTAGTPFDGSTIAKISVGAFHTCAVGGNRAVACWGSGSQGAIGNGSTARASIPTSPTLTGTPLDGKDIAVVSAARYSTCAATTAGTLVCWGAGDDGQLANGGTMDSTIPVAATTAGTPLQGAGVVGIDSGLDHHCAQTSSGIAVCWGRDLNGVQGSGIAGNALVATAVAVGGTSLDGVTIKEIAAGDGGACAVGTTKRPFCWGRGRITGSGTSTTAPLPVPTSIDNIAPPDAPTVTVDGVDNARVTLTWTGIANTGGSAITTTRVRGYVNGVETVSLDRPPADPRGASSGSITVEYDQTYRFTVALGNLTGFGPESAPSGLVAIGSEPLQYTSYHPITPCRILDTRVAGGTLGDREIRDVQVGDDGNDIADQGGNPAGCPVPAGVGAVEASVTAVGPADSGFFRAWPSDESMPNATFMNFDTGMDITNTGSITISQDSDDNELRIRNFGGTSHYVIDIQGYYEVADENGAPTPATTAAANPDPTSYVAITPCRIVDTRQAGGTLGNREIRDVQALGSGGGFAAQGGKSNGCDLPTGAAAVEASVTAVGPADSGFFRAWPSDESMPNATFMNFDTGMDITNTGAITINNEHATDHLRIRNFGGTSHYVIDIQGYYLPNAPAAPNEATTSAASDPTTYVAITPCRIMDTRQAGGVLTNREIRDVTVTQSSAAFAAQGGTAGGCGIPADAEAVEASVTAVGPADSGFFRAWPSDESMPNATFMNFDTGMDITNTGAITINNDPATNHLRIRNFGGTSHYVIDIQGYFIGDLPN